MNEIVDNIERYYEIQEEAGSDAKRLEEGKKMIGVKRLLEKMMLNAETQYDDQYVPIGAVLDALDLKKPQQVMQSLISLQSDFSFNENMEMVKQKSLIKTHGVTVPAIILDYWHLQGREGELPSKTGWSDYFFKC